MNEVSLIDGAKAVPSISKSQQDVTATVYVRIGGHKVMVEVRSNAYLFQSHARAKVWNTQTLSWNLVYSIPSGNMRTREAMYVYANVGPKDFQADIDALLAGARAVLVD